MDEGCTSRPEGIRQKCASLDLLRACLSDQRLSERVVASDQEFVASAQALKKPQAGDAIKFPIYAAVTAAACEDEIPYLVDLQAGP